jgi:O-antigen ligase
VYSIRHLVKQRATYPGDRALLQAVVTKRLVFQASFRFHALSDSDTKIPDRRTILKNADMMVIVSLNATSSLPAAPGAVQPVDLSWDPQYQNPLRRLAFYVVLVIVFLRFSTLQEIVAAKTGQQLYLLYLLVPLGWLGYLTTGGPQRTFLRRGAFFWVAFAAWMVIDIPFSEWRGGTAGYVLTYFKTDLPMVLFVSGLVMGWKECRQVLYVIAAGSVLNVVGGRLLMRDDYRVSMDFAGTIANSNDFAAHLILVLPVTMFLVLRPNTAKIIRVAALGVIVMGLYLILGTASRGAMISMGVAALFLFIKMRPKARLALLVAAPVAALALLASLPPQTLARLTTFSTTITEDSADIDEHAQADASESAAVRSYVFYKSLYFTLHRPLFGVGPGQFTVAEGGLSKSEGKRGSWHETHNAYTQVSSECGIPGLIFFLGGLFSIFKLLNEIWKKSRMDPRFREMEIATNLLMVGLTGYCTAIIFLSHGYRFYLPTLTGLAVAMSVAAAREFAQIQTPMVRVGFNPSGPRVAPAVRVQAFQTQSVRTPSAPTPTVPKRTYISRKDIGPWRGASGSPKQAGVPAPQGPPGNRRP